MKAQSGLFAGLMSGTSLDGVDAVLADFASSLPRVVGTAYLPYPARLKASLLSLNHAGHDELRRASELGVELAGLYAETIALLLESSQVNASQVSAIGCHGQTVRHQPQAGYSLQLNHPALLAERCGIAVVADFRNRDIAAGGQGAPLVPAFHDYSLRVDSHHRVVLNIGGIANLSDLAPGRATRGFDSGPGNMLLDAWVQRHLGTPWDNEGHWAKQGQCLPDLLKRLLAHPFLARRAPKSCGREEFSLEWLLQQLDGNEAAADVQATLLVFTASTISAAIAAECGTPDELLVCGGGVHNRALLAALALALPQTELRSTASAGISPDYLEALAFAWLARQCYLGLPGNLAEVTGAAGPRILGAIYPR